MALLEKIFHCWCSIPLVKQAIGHFTVVYLVAKPLIWSEAEGDLVVIETSIQVAFEKQQGLYHNMVTLCLIPVERLGNQAHNCKMDY